MKYLLSLIIACVILSACVAEPKPSSPSTVETPTASPTATAIPTPEATPITGWRQFTPDQISEIDRLMDEYIDREHAGAVMWADDAEMRYGMCIALEGNAWDLDRFVESGESLVFQGVILVDDWLIMRDLASYLMYLVQQPTMDAYFESRRAGETTIPPMPTMGNAYCAHNLFKP